MEGVDGPVTARELLLQNRWVRHVLVFPVVPVDSILASALQGRAGGISLKEERLERRLVILRHVLPPSDGLRAALVHLLVAKILGITLITAEVF